MNTTRDNLMSPEYKVREGDVPLATLRQVSAIFDAEFYLSNYPDVKESGDDPIIHYLELGWKEGRDPSAAFDTKAYLEANPDVKNAGVCPLVEYVTSGVVIGRRLRPSPSGESDRQKISTAFDLEYYLETYPDVGAAGLDAIEHYLISGWREYRNPSTEFDTRYYLEAHPDVRESGICPLVHYVTRGAGEGRLPRRPKNPARDVINTAVAREERIKPWLRPLTSPSISAHAFQRDLSALVKSSVRGIALSLSHDDYATVVGGVQNSVADEERALREKGWAHLHLCPAQPLPVLADPTAGENFFVQVRGNAVPIGVASIATLVSELGHVDWTGVPRVLILHQLMGFCPELLIDLATVFSPDNAIVCIHDFFTLCPSWAMLRNNVAFCGGPPPDSQACSICAYGGGEREQHLERLAGLFATLKPHILAPSETALQFWLSHSSFEYATARVIPHGELLMEPTLRPAKTEVHLRVGFAGGAAFHKGWHVFEELASRHSNDSRYSFFHFGGERAGRAREVTFVKVTVQPDQRQAMIDSLIANEIDVVVNWSLCYETFCYSAYERAARLQFGHRE